MSALLEVGGKVQQAVADERAAQCVRVAISVVNFLGLNLLLAICISTTLKSEVTCL